MKVGHVEIELNKRTVGNTISALHPTEGKRKG